MFKQYVFLEILEFLGQFLICLVLLLCVYLNSVKMDLIIPKYLPILKFIVIDAFSLVSQLVLSCWREITNSILSCSVVCLFWGMVVNDLLYSPLFVIYGICYWWSFLFSFDCNRWNLLWTQIYRFLLWMSVCSEFCAL